MKRFEEVTRSLKNIKSALDLLKTQGENTEDVFDIEDNFRGSPAMQACMERVRAIPEIQDMMKERYLGPAIDVDALYALPRGTLGNTYASVMKALGYDPNFYRVRQMETDEDWLAMRLRKYHDIRHIVTGFGPTGGELGVLAVVGVQIGYPVCLFLQITSMAGALKVKPEELAAMTHQVARGMAMGLEAKPLIAPRWEEWWEKPLTEVRQELNITNPVIDEPYSLKNRLPDLDLPW
jgi:ubiquinone biosynthesis protein COQ4